MYTDGFVLPVPKKGLAKYKKIATTAARVWIDHGALTYHECVGEDIQSASQYGMVAFDKLAGVKKDEVVLFSFITYKSRAHRDKVMKAVMADPRIKCDPASMPFDCSRMAAGGFEAIVSAEAKGKKKPAAKKTAKKKPVAKKKK